MNEKKVREAIKEFEVEKQTYEDAISYCKHFEPKNDCGRYEEKIAICKTAIEALEKQLPKKVEYEDGFSNNGFARYRMAKCPTCDRWYNSNEGAIYCVNCCQRLDWSE